MVSKMAPKTRAMQSRLEQGFRVDDLFPPTIDSPEKDFHRNFGSIGSRRYRFAHGLRRGSPSPWISALASTKDWLYPAPCVPEREGQFFTTARTTRTAGLIGHQEQEGPHVLLGRPVPVAQQDRVDHQTGLALPEQEVSDGLRHQVTPGEADEDRYWVNRLADEGDGVGDGNGPKDLRDVVALLLSKAYLKRCGELTAVVVIGWLSPSMLVC